MPFGGKTQLSETQVSVQKLPTDGYTNTASIMSFGYNPFIAEWSPYHSAAYAVVEACTKVVAAGADYSRMRFSYQEYFERMSSEHAYGKPLSALLGALKMQVAFGLPSIGGKDSMSGTFEHISVPPTLIAFGITTVPADKVVSTDLKQAGHKLYLIKHNALANYMPNVEQLKENWTYTTNAIQSGKVCATFALGFGGVAEALAKMSFGNELAVNVQIAENELFDYNYGSILVEATEDLTLPAAQLIGTVIEGTHLIINNERVCREVLLHACCGQFDKIYPSAVPAQHQALMPADTLPNSLIASSPIAYNGSAVETPLVYIPVFPGTNCDYDSAKAWRKAGAEVETTIFRNLTGEDVLSSIDEMVEHINRCHILMFAGGFSAGDEPDGSGKFIASVINNQKVGAAITALIDRGGLILGICNGFQALVKSGLLPYGKLGMVTPYSPTLFRNDINRHISQMVTTTVATTASPWLRGMQVGDTHSIAVSHGEGKFVVNEALAKELFENGQVAFRYADPMTGEATMEAPYNPNGSYYAIEGIISRNGQILGKMGHTERWEDGVFTNIAGNKCQPLFDNAVAYFRKK